MKDLREIAQDLVDVAREYYTTERTVKLSQDKCEFFKAEDFLIDLSEYPLASEAIIRTFRYKIAGIANRILSKRGQRVYAHSTGSEWTTTHKPAPGEWFDQRRTALLIDVREIERDTAESLLRELVSWRAKNEHDLGVPADVAERARKLLGRQAGEL